MVNDNHVSKQNHTTEVKLTGDYARMVNVIADHEGDPNPTACAKRLVAKTYKGIVKAQQNAESRGANVLDPSKSHLAAS